MEYKVYYNVRSQKSCDHLLQELEKRGLRSGSYDKPTIISNLWYLFGRETVIVIRRGRIVTYTSTDQLRERGEKFKRYTPKTEVVFTND